MDYILILDQFFSLLENYEDVCGTKIIIFCPGYMISLRPRAVTQSYQHFNQQTRHSTNYCSIMILLMLANVDVCFPLCCRVEACLVITTSTDLWSVRVAWHILSGVTRTILPRGGEGERAEDHTSIINFCLLENSSFSHEKNMLFPVLCGHSIIFFARGKSGFIYQSITSHV